MNKGGYEYIVSACLAGVKCRYDGIHSAMDCVKKLVEQGKALPVCAEVLAGLPCPRPSCEMQIVEGETRIISKTGEDLTEAFRQGAQKTLEIAKVAGIKKAILQQRSPSCGCGKVYDGSFNGQLVEGKGLTTQLLEENDIEVIASDRFCG